MIIIPGYQVTGQIYEGERSIIYRGLREADSNPVVIKLFYKPYPTLAELDRFRREYDINRLFDSAGIIKVYGFERYNHSPLIILEDFPGKSLAEYLKESPFHPARFLPLSIRIAEALDQIHRMHVIHKDINPGNILWDKDSGQIRIIDFGISTYFFSKTPDPITPDVLQGTLAYISPEQTGRMNRPVDYHTDFYSLGVTFYQMLTGRLPFESGDPMTLVHSHMAIHPEEPGRINPRIPRTISDIVMKLMEKNAEDRYQGAPGLIWDLQACLDGLNTLGRIPVFAIGKKDIPRKFHIPQKLYGRDDEISTILAAFDRAALGKKEMILIAGPPGIGKSAVIGKVKKDLDQTRGYFIYGKFDQFQRNIPYSALVQAGKALCHQIAAGGDASVLFWKEKLGKAMGPNGRVMTNLIPELELIIGIQPEIPELSAADAQNRFNLTLLNFLGAFHKERHALAICMDDLQWADEASLKIFELILNEPDSGHLLFIGTYRDNEVDEAHPLTGFLGSIDPSETPIIRMILNPLGKSDINRFLSEILLCGPGKSDQVASLCHEKTRGNPFFFIQMMQALYDGRHIFFDPDAGRWKWDAGEIKRVNIADNVVELMMNTIRRLTDYAQNALKLAACIGTRFDLKTLSAVSRQSVMETQHQLWPALEQGLVVPAREALYELRENHLQTDTGGENAVLQDINPEYMFVHDRIQQAAYEMLPEGEKIHIHIKIGYLLLESARHDETGEKVFDIATHLNAGSDGITDPEKRFALARLNLNAGKKAKMSAAFQPSLKYLKAGIALLPENSWAHNYPETFELTFEAAESAFFCTDFDDMKELADTALEHARNVLEKAKIYSLRVQYYYAQNELMKVVEEGTTILGLMGYRFPANPTKLHILLKLAGAGLALKAKMPSKVNGLKDIEDPAILTAMRIMIHLGHAAFGAHPNLTPLLSLQVLLLSISHGIAPETPVSFIFYGVVLCGAFHRIEAGFDFARLALELNDRPVVRNFRARAVFFMGGMIIHWKHHLKDALHPYLLNAYNIGMAAGDYEFATLSAFFYCAYSYFLGAPLSGLSSEMATYSTTIRKSRQTTHFYFNEMVRQVVLNLMGASADPCRLAGEAYDEAVRLPWHRKTNDTSAVHMLFLYKMQLCYLFGRYPEALECSHTVETCLEGMLGTVYVPLFHFYDSLIRLALISDGTIRNKREKKRFLKKTAANQKKFRRWAFHSPMNYQHKWLLVEAERMGISGRTSDAIDCYNQSISLAGKQEYIQEEALANELAAGFWRKIGNSDIAETYLKKAVYCYEVWGATAKADLLYQTHPLLIGLKRERPDSYFEKKQSGTTVSTASQTLDLESAIKASQTISGEIVLEELMRKLMTVVVENSGAQKALLLSRPEKQWVIEAEGYADRQGVAVSIISKTALASDAPLSIFQYVALTGETILLNNAAGEGEFQQDAYVRTHQLRSVLSSPILHQGKMKNVIYLENNLIEGAFTLERVALLRLVSAQAAISLENARLYARLQESEKKYRAIFENAVEGLFQITPDGRFISANKTMAALLGFPSPESLMNDSEIVINDYFSDSRERDSFATALAESGQVFGFEGRGVRKDGGEFWGVISAREVRDSNGDVLLYEGSLIDITERKGREKAEREKEAAQATARVKSEFLANMSHEIRTPMNAIMGLTEVVAKTGLSFNQSGYIEKIRESSKTLLNIINDILDFSKIEAGKLELECVGFNLDAIFDKIAWMFAGPMEKNGPELVFSTSGKIPGLRGDPLRLEQVLMNLVGNAFKFTKTGEIAVSAELLEETNTAVRMRFTVSDTGIGISKEHTEKLFQAFSQADGSITRQYGGTGLGLAICKSIVEKMGGNIRVESAEGRGSRFIFDAVLGPGPLPEIIGLPGDLMGLKALVAASNPLARQVITEDLRALGFVVTACGFGEEVIETLKNAVAPVAGQNNAWDVILMDQKMPGMDGIESARKIRRDFPHAKIPVIIMGTAYGREETADAAAGAGIDAFLVKPARPALLVDAVMAAFHRNHAGTGPEKRPSKAAESEIPLNIRGIHVLVVDDSETNRQVIRELLEGERIRVTLAHNGRQALSVIDDAFYDAVLMDIQMPGMDGYETAKRIRQDPRHEQLPIIALTANALEGSREKCLNAGMNDVVTKPIDYHQLYAKLAMVAGAAGPSGRGDGIPGKIPAVSPTVKLSGIELSGGFAGIDVAAGLKRLGGKRELYVRMLREFRKEYQDAPGLLAEALKKGDRELIRRTAHTIKGLAANIGAEDLKSIAAKIEAASIPGGPLPTLSDLDVFNDHLEKFFAVSKRIEAYLAEAKSGSAALETRPLEPVEKVRGELNRMLGEGQSRALLYYKSNMAWYLDHAQMGHLSRQLERCIENYDFEDARNILAEIVLPDIVSPDIVLTNIADPPD
ncbi:MAG: response regulator [Desulfosalsimonadaceae bacterium]